MTDQVSENEPNSQARLLKRDRSLMPDRIEARIWARLGIVYTRKRYYLKAFLCLETALAIDPASVAGRHYLILRLIKTGKLQDAYDLVTKAGQSCDRVSYEPWSFA